MIEMTLARVAELTGGTLAAADPATRVTGPVEYDSRKLTGGGLFAAFVGEHVDGHDFAEAALAAGTVVAICMRLEPEAGLPSTSGAACHSGALPLPAGSGAAETKLAHGVSAVSRWALGTTVWACGLDMPASNSSAAVVPAPRRKLEDRPPRRRSGLDIVVSPIPWKRKRRQEMRHAAERRT